MDQLQRVGETELDLLEESDEESDESMSAGSVSSEEVDEAEIEVASPGDMMKPHFLRKNSEGDLVHVCCGEQDEDEQDPPRGRSRVRSRA